jgi:hypothetical protein
VGGRGEGKGGSAARTWRAFEAARTWQLVDASIAMDGEGKPSQIPLVNDEGVRSVFDFDWGCVGAARGSTPGVDPGRQGAPIGGAR